jgi:hypothetical protein
VVTGFEPAEIDMLFADRGSPKPDPGDELPMVAGDAIARPGDLWCLGQHRILCGDARSRADLDRLMNDARAQMLFADPPYNVRISSVQGRGRIKHQEFAFASGEMSEQEYAYKVDRLTRSLADFAKLVELFETHGVSFVAVTQQFNTTTSMGRLTLNVLLSFAQFERELASERIRDSLRPPGARACGWGAQCRLGMR